MCANYIRRGRVTEFVPTDVVPAQQPPCQDPALPWHVLLYTVSFTQFPGTHSRQKGARKQGVDGGAGGCTAL
ncbi:hypothetical protein OYC64_000228 [Pagothenia borchgrevinki]|uniref:Uncharacterized protein n=1 Tax=Pagothenia borchgrevinki TaxID=8213 RepID=A0ABD2HBT7_PAGBO